MTACTMESMTMPASVNPCLHVDRKYSLARSTYCRLKVCLRSSSSFSQISEPDFIFRMLLKKEKMLDTKTIRPVEASREETLVFIHIKTTKRGCCAGGCEISDL
ncbi:hypothetical protein INR49_001273 [Caranx melampygus]|nr:hypothetical protein INR49_001273 [Caranx melampygus]